MINRVKNVGINGFGRIGRNLVRAALTQTSKQGKPPINIVAVNDLTDINTIVHLLKYDSILGPLQETVTVEDNIIHIGDIFSIIYTQERDPNNIPWATQFNVDTVVESTGIFTTYEKAKTHMHDGVSKVIISAPADGADITLVLGVNDNLYNPAQDHIISNASCTTNCLAPIAKTINDAYGITEGAMVTVHAYTNDQNLMDAPHKDLRRARAAATNIIPTSTGAAKAVGLVIPELEGKLDGYALRVPTPTGSLVSLTMRLNNPDVTVTQINEAIKNAANTNMKGIIEYTEDPIVSSDIVTNPHSAIFDATLTEKTGELIKIVAWYDNEWGYTNRLLEVTART